LRVCARCAWRSSERREPQCITQQALDSCADPRGFTPSAPRQPSMRCRLRKMRDALIIGYTAFRQAQALALKMRPTMAPSISTSKSRPHKVEARGAAHRPTRTVIGWSRDSSSSQPTFNRAGQLRADAFGGHPPPDIATEYRIGHVARRSISRKEVNVCSDAARRAWVALPRLCSGVGHQELP
jgi:hypothetical protein